MPFHPPPWQKNLKSTDSFMDVFLQQLINVSPGVHLWADRDWLHDVFGIIGMVNSRMAMSSW